MKRGSDITVIVVTYNSAHIIGDMISELPKDYSIIVVDNHSNDGTCEVVENITRDNLLLIKSSRNIGYGAGNNAGFRVCKTRYALVMNPDAMITSDNVEKLRLALESDDRAVLAGPGPSTHYTPYYLFDREQPVLRSGLHMLTRDSVRIEDYGRAYRTGCVAGAAFLYDLCKMPELIFYDENMVLYYEEVEFVYRLREAGYYALFVPYAEFSHKGESSSRESMSQRGAFWYRNYYAGYSKGYLSCKYGDRISGIEFWWYLFRLRMKAFMSCYGFSLRRIIKYNARLEGFMDALNKFG